MDLLQVRQRDWEWLEEADLSDLRHDRAEDEERFDSIRQEQKEYRALLIATHPTSEERFHGFKGGGQVTSP